MNRRMVIRIISWVLLIEAVAMLPPLALSIGFVEIAARRAFAITIALCLALSALTLIFPPRRKSLYATEVYVITALSWIIISVFGALPFIFSGEVPNFFSALFETVSGFTTTGATILHDVEAVPRSLLYWRSFTHWLGGMGVLVFLLAIVTAGSGEGNLFYLMRAESPGYDVGKMTPRLRQSAMTLYVIYLVLTVIQVVFLLCGGMSLFDSLCIAFGTAGTGGFSITNNGLAAYSPYCQSVCTVFMLLFGVNFSLYYLILCRQFRLVARDEELWTYLGLFLGATVLITLNIMPMMKSGIAAFHHAAFQVSSIMTTTGFNTVDFDVWPSFSKAILILLMFIGASAGSTGGGLKVSRLLIGLKTLKREANKILHPRNVRVIRMNGHSLDERVVTGVSIFFIAYIILMCVSVLLVSLDGYGFETNFTAVLSCMSNIGPGLAQVGPTCNFDIYSNLAKLVLTFDMLFGRLEIFPMLILFMPTVWRRNAGLHR